MAPLQQKGDGWLPFLYKNSRYNFTVGRVDEDEARAVAAKFDYALMRLKQRLFSVPAGVDIVTFVCHGGHPPADAGAAKVQ